MVDISEEEILKSMIRSGSTILTLRSFLGSCACNGAVLMWVWNCLRADPYFSHIKSGKNSRQMAIVSSLS